MNLHFHAHKKFPFSSFCVVPNPTFPFSILLTILALVVNMLALGALMAGFSASLVLTFRDQGQRQRDVTQQQPIWLTYYMLLPPG
jgi:hypothetical protein